MAQLWRQDLHITCTSGNSTWGHISFLLVSFVRSTCTCTQPVHQVRNHSHICMYGMCVCTTYISFVVHYSVSIFTCSWVCSRSVMWHSSVQVYMQYSKTTWGLLCLLPFHRTISCLGWDLNPRPSLSWLSALPLSYRDCSVAGAQITCTKQLNF